MKTFKILSIDGGGIKGLYSAKILESIEKSLQKEHEKEDIFVGDFFDLICGTSTGGLIALGISQRKPMSKICDFYSTKGNKIFPRSNSLSKKIKQLLFSSKYRNDNLRKSLIEFFGKDVCISSSNNLLCIPSYDATHGTYAIFKFDHKEGKLIRHNDLKYVDVALATSAAPTYFPIWKIKDLDNTQFVDGGVWANNPSLIGLSEALRYFVGKDKEYDSIEILSIASIALSHGLDPKSKGNKSIYSWGENLFNMCLGGQSEFTNNFLYSIQNLTDMPLSYLRIESPKINPNHIKYISLDNCKKESIDLISQYGSDTGLKAKNSKGVMKFFEASKTYITNV